MSDVKILRLTTGEDVIAKVTHNLEIDTVTVAKDKIVFMTEPKDDLLKSYQSNTSTIISANTPGLITENSVPKL